MDSLQTTPKNGRSLAANQTDPLATLPSWLRYLVGAFPNAKVASTTFAVYEDQFSDVDQALMLGAIRQAIKGYRFANFPTIAELRQVVSGLEYEEAVAKRPRLNLTLLRHELIEQAHDGQIDAARWTELYRQYLAHKRIDGAFAIARLYERYTDGATLPR